MSEEELRLIYMPLGEISLLQGNAKRHDLQKIAESIQRYGYKNPARYEPTLNNGDGGVVAGNGRIESLRWMQQQGRDAPRGIIENLKASNRRMVGSIKKSAMVQIVGQF